MIEPEIPPDAVFSLSSLSISRFRALSKSSADTAKTTAERISRDAIPEQTTNNLFFIVHSSSKMLNQRLSVFLLGVQRMERPAVPCRKFPAFL
jgi:hypothetical protein